MLATSCRVLRRVITSGAAAAAACQTSTQPQTTSSNLKPNPDPKPQNPQNNSKPSKADTLNPTRLTGFWPNLLKNPPKRQFLQRCSVPNRCPEGAERRGGEIPGSGLTNRVTYGFLEGVLQGAFGSARLGFGFEGFRVLRFRVLCLSRVKGFGCLTVGSLKSPGSAWGTQGLARAQGAAGSLLKFSGLGPGLGSPSSLGRLGSIT